METGSSYTFLISTTLLLISTFAKGASARGSQYIVKTIKVDGGDIVDCIDIYKQPAFSHPLLVNHTIQTQPSKETSTLRSKNGEFKVYQSWHKKGRSCPHGSIPIKRHQNSNHQLRKKYAPPPQGQGPINHQYAVIGTPSLTGTIHGAYATLNVWNPQLNADGFSLSQIWLTAGSGGDHNTLEAGWHVFPSYNGDSQTRMFIYWTRDNYQSTGCYDVVNCPGFVQTSSDFLIGGTIEISAYDGEQKELSLSIQKDSSSGNWWLYVNENAIGYWPQSLFTSIANAADVVQWGGEVYDLGGGNSNQMGNGNFPNEGYKRSSYTRDIKYVDTSGSVVEPSFGDLQIIRTSCYNLQNEYSGNQLYLFFGGPGCA